MGDGATSLTEAYQLAAHELRNLRGLDWDDLSPREDAPWLFGGGDLGRLADAHGGITIVDSYGGNPGVKRLAVALEWLHGRQGRRAVRLIAFVNRAED